MFNFSGSEIVFLLLLALIILGPEKLPEAVRKFGKTYAEFKKVTTGFQSELKQALDEPMREMRETAEMFKQAATFDVVNPVEEATSALKSVAEGGPATVTPDGSPAKVVSADDVSGAAPPLASAAAAAAAATAAAMEEHRPFESKIISGGPRVRSLDEVMAERAAAAEAHSTDGSESSGAESEPESTSSSSEPESTPEPIAAEPIASEPIASEPIASEPTPERDGAATDEQGPTPA